MNIQTYQQAAQRTMKPLGSLMLDMTHMCLGMSTELGELIEGLELVRKESDHNPKPNLTNVAEEIGDAMWYIANYATLRGIELDDTVYNHQMTDLSMITAGGRLADYAKRWLAYDQELHDQKRIAEETSLVHEYVSCLEHVASRLGLDIEDIMAKNILKLYVRYPEKFSADAALVRDLEAEKAVLEGKKS